MSETIELFVHGDNIPDIKLVRVPKTATLRDVVEAARAEGLPVAADHSEAAVLVDGRHDALEMDRVLEELGLAHHHHLHYRHRHKAQTVTITIKVDKKTEERHVRRGEHSVTDIKNIGGVPQAYDLEEIVAGKLQPLSDTTPVNIRGGEVFIAHVMDTGSS